MTDILHDVAEGTIMNKLTKASIAGAAGFALLLGGAGTLAAWNTSTSVNAGVITAGSLSLSQPATVGDGWMSGTTPIDINNFAVSPGDTLTYTKTLKVNAVGDNLKARLAIDTTAIPVQGTSSADQALAGLVLNALSDVNQVFTVHYDHSALTYDVTTRTFTVQPGHNGSSSTITLIAKFTIPNGALGAENAAMGGHVNLNGVKVTLTQI